MEVNVYNIKGEDTGRKVTLNESIFGIEPNDHAIYLDVKQFMANQRQGTHKSKERSEISGSTRKLGRQKGGGGARRGDINSPVLVGGARVFGPKPRDYWFKLNKKVKTLARKSALSYKAQENAIIIVEDFTFEAPKTKDFVSMVNNLKMQAGPSLNASLDWTLFMLTSTIILAAGSMFILWLGERITDKGIGNGISLIIMVGIIARLPQSLFQELISRMTDKTGGLVMFLIELVVLLLVIAFAILLVQGTRKIPVQYAKKIVGNKQYGGARQYIPLKVNAANVMPIIFAQAIMFIPITLVGFSNVNNASGFIHALTDHTSFWYNLIFAVLIILFTYFYTAITINPTQMAEDMKRNNGFIPGIKPGKQTAEYIDVIMSRITLPGSFFLALVAIMPAFAGIFGVKAEFAQFFGGTSLLILVGVVLDTLQQVESHLLMRHYDGLLKSGRIKGRSGTVAAY